jgi:hypothetical protein
MGEHEEPQAQTEPTAAPVTEWQWRLNATGAAPIDLPASVIDDVSGQVTCLPTVELADLRRRAAMADGLLQAQLRQAATIVRLRSEVGALKERLLDLDAELTLEQRGCELWQDIAELRERRRAGLLARVQRTAEALEQSIRRIPCHDSAEREAALALVAELRSEVTT